MGASERIVMLSIGVGRYQHQEIQDLALPPADARAMARAIVDLGHAETLVRVLLNESATKANLHSALEWLARSVEPDDLAILYYSGHGARFLDQDGDEADNYDEFLCPCDTGVGGGVETLIRDDELRSWLSAVTAKTQRLAVLLDCCHSGDAVRLGGATPKELDRSLVEALLGDYRRPRKRSGLFLGEGPLQGHMLLAAAEAHQSSYEIAGMDNGLFTTYLLQGLADPSISAFEALFAFARDRVERDAVQFRIQQNPHLIPRAEGDLAYR
jgi:uncharacterized caspase-like protein